MKENIEIVPTLAKKTDIEQDNIYLRTLKAALNNKNVKNVGVFGVYGSGKSSVVGSYLENSNQCDNTIFFSLDTFNKHIDDGSEDLNIRESFYKELLNYDKNTLDMSGYEKNKRIKRLSKTILSLSFVLYAIVSVFLGFYLFSFIGWTSILVGIAFSLLASMLSIFLFDKKFKQLEISLTKYISLSFEKDKEKNNVDINQIPNIENLIIEILHTRNIQYIVIEDVERFYKGNVNRIKKLIIEFKLLNELINRSNYYKKKPIVFIYGLKDGCFNNSEVRAKYFDFILPVLPFASHSNAKQALFNENIIKESFKESEQEIINIIAPYFSNQREVNAFLIEFAIMKTNNEHRFLQLKEEIAALSAMNVLFPRAFNELYNKNNYLHGILNEDVDAENLYELILDKLEDYKVAVDDNGEKNLFLYDDKNQLKTLARFIASCVIAKAITYNFENLIVTNRGSFLTDSDNEVEQKIRARMDITNCDINDPVELVKNFSPKSHLFSDNRCVNADIAYAVGQIGDEKMIEELHNLLGNLQTSDLLDFLNKYLKKYKSESNIVFITSILKSNVSIYNCVPKLSESKNEVAFALLNCLDINFLKTNSEKPLDFFKYIQSKAFLDEYHNKIEAPKVEKLIGEDFICFESIEYWKSDEAMLRVFRDCGGYSVSFSNLIVVFKEFKKKPIDVITSNTFLKKKIIANTISLKNALDKCDSDTQDTVEKVKQFCIEMASNDSTIVVLDSSYFDKWKLKLSAKGITNTTTNVALLKRCFWDLNEQDVCDSIAFSVLPKSFIEAIKNNKELINENVYFSEKTSWLIVSKLEENELIAIKKSLTLTNPKNYIPAYGLDIVKSLAISDTNGRQEIIKECIRLDQNKFFELVQSSKISTKELEEIKLSEAVLSTAISKSSLRVTNAFSRGINTEFSLHYLSSHKDGNGWMLFFNENEECIGTDNETLALYYCDNFKTENFDKITKLIVAMDDGLFKSNDKWIVFLKSFAFSNDGKYLLFDNYPNNECILSKMMQLGIIKDCRYVNKYDKLKVKM